MRGHDLVVVEREDRQLVVHQLHGVDYGLVPRISLEALGKALVEAVVVRVGPAAAVGSHPAVGGGGDVLGVELEEKRRLVQAGVRGRKGGKSRTELAIGILYVREEPGADIDADSPPAVRDDGVLALLLAVGDRAQLGAEALTRGRHVDAIAAPPEAGLSE